MRQNGSPPPTPVREVARYGANGGRRWNQPLRRGGDWVGPVNRREEMDEDCVSRYGCVKCDKLLVSLECCVVRQGHGGLPVKVEGRSEEPLHLMQSCKVCESEGSRELTHRKKGDCIYTYEGSRTCLNIEKMKIGYKERKTSMYACEVACNDGDDISIRTGKSD